MPIVDQSFVPKPPVFHAHRHVAGESVDDLNEWATSLFSPTYSDATPAFQADGTGALHARQGRQFTLAVPDGHWIVLSPNSSISIADPLSFQAAYAPEG